MPIASASSACRARGSCAVLHELRPGWPTPTSVPTESSSASKQNTSTPSPVPGASAPATSRCNERGTDGDAAAGWRGPDRERCPAAVRRWRCSPACPGEQRAAGTRRAMSIGGQGERRRAPAQERARLCKSRPAFTSVPGAATIEAGPLAGRPSRSAGRCTAAMACLSDCRGWR